MLSLPLQLGVFSFYGFSLNVYELFCIYGYMPNHNIISNVAKDTNVHKQQTLIMLGSVTTQQQTFQSED